jgi:hypothetical protein
VLVRDALLSSGDRRWEAEMTLSSQSYISRSGRQQIKKIIVTNSKKGHEGTKHGLSVRKPRRTSCRGGSHSWRRWSLSWELSPGGAEPDLGQRKKEGEHSKPGAAGRGSEHRDENEGWPIQEWGEPKGNTIDWRESRHPFKQGLEGRAGAWTFLQNVTPSIIFVILLFSPQN